MTDVKKNVNYDFNPENEGIIFLRNVGMQPNCYSAQQPSKPQSVVVALRVFPL
jgi:hypothetical protein